MCIYTHIYTIKQLGSAENCSWPKEPYAVTTMPFSWHQRTRSLVSDGTWGRKVKGKGSRMKANCLSELIQQRAQSTNFHMREKCSIHVFSCV